MRHVLRIITGDYWLQPYVCEGWYYFLSTSQHGQSESYTYKNCRPQYDNLKSVCINDNSHPTQHSIDSADTAREQNRKPERKIKTYRCDNRNCINSNPSCKPPAELKKSAHDPSNGIIESPFKLFIDFGNVEFIKVGNKKYHPKSMASGTANSY